MKFAGVDPINFLYGFMVPLYCSEDRVILKYWCFMVALLYIGKVGKGFLNFLQPPPLVTIVCWGSVHTSRMNERYCCSWT